MTGSRNGIVMDKRGQTQSVRDRYGRSDPFSLTFISILCKINQCNEEVTEKTRKGSEEMGDKPEDQGSEEQKGLRP